MARVVFSNKKAYHNFTVVDKIEAGIVLEGWEVKSIKASMGDFKGSYAVLDSEGNLSLRNMRVDSWKTGIKQSDEHKKRDRQLLLHKSQIAKLAGLLNRPGYTVVPLEVYVNDKKLIKVQIGVVKGKKKFERKRDAKERDMKRKMQQELNDI